MNPDQPRLKIAIIGRPNVGKSALFNRMVGKKLALVEAIPGTTRDRREAFAHLNGLHLVLIDTAGLEAMQPSEAQTLTPLMMQQTDKAITDAQVLFFVIDGREALTPADLHFVDGIRKSGKPTLLLANKCEGKKASPYLEQAERMGFGAPLPISALEGFGLQDLGIALRDLLEAKGMDNAYYHKLALPKQDEEDPLQEGEEAKDNRPIQIAIVGRPNVGKSTLFNRFLGEERSIVSTIAGTTRDSVYVEFEWRGTKVQLVDTAGLRKKTKRSEDTLEAMSVEDSFRAIQYASVVILLLDATASLERVELQLAEHILTEGRAMIVAANKWDLVTDAQEQLTDLRERVERTIVEAKGVPIVTLSALSGNNVDKLIAQSLRLHRLWNRRVSTGKLNRWIEKATSQHIPPLANGNRIRFKYITQVKSRPPTFALFTTSNVSDLPKSYLRYLIASLREELGFNGVPIRLFLRKQDNPFADKTGPQQGKKVYEPNAKKRPREARKPRSRPHK